MIEILVGNIACGKSTYAAEAAQRGAVIINDDAITLAVHGGDYSLYSKTWNPIYKAVQLNIAISALGMGKTVVVDKTTVTRKARRRWIGLAHAFDVPTHVICFDLSTMGNPEVAAQRRFDTDARGFSYDWWFEVAKRKASQYEAPTPEEGMDAVYTTEWMHNLPVAKLMWRGAK